MTKTKSDISESCYSDLIFLRENNFQKDQTTFWPLNLTMKFLNALLGWLISSSE